MNHNSSLHYFIPALVAILVAIAFIIWPILAAVIMSGFLFLFAMIYSWVVYQFQQFQKGVDQHLKSQDFENWEHPDFKNVTIYIKNQSKRFFV